MLSPKVYYFSDYVCKVADIPTEKILMVIKLRKLRLKYLILWVQDEAVK